MDKDTLIASYKELEVTYEQFMEARRTSYILQYKVRNALKSIQSPLDISYNKYSSKARREARKLLGKKRGYAIDHKVALKLLWALGISIEEANNKDNLCFLKKKDNTRKSFKVDWEVYERLYGS